MDPEQISKSHDCNQPKEKIKEEILYPNFKNENGKWFLVRRPNCKRENYALNVATEFCTWCAFDAN